MEKTSRAPATTASTIRDDEAAHFGALAADWWDPKGKSAMLHRLNPVRMRYIRDAIDRHFGCDPTTLRPLQGRRALDVGCGAGLVTEPLARLGGNVTGLDAAPENIAAARAHAKAAGLAIDYACADVATFGPGDFDLVTSLEVIEHVGDPDAFVAALARRMATGGLLVLSTPNRTAWSKLLLVDVAEMTGRIPRGTHDHDRFLTPGETRALLDAAGLDAIDTTGIGYSPARGFELGDDTRLNYLMTAVKRAAGPLVSGGQAH